MKISKVNFPILLFAVLLAQLPVAAKAEGDLKTDPVICSLTDAPSYFCEIISPSLERPEILPPLAPEQADFPQSLPIEPLISRGIDDVSNSILPESPQLPPPLAPEERKPLDFGCNRPDSKIVGSVVFVNANDEITGGYNLCGVEGAWGNIDFAESVKKEEYLDYNPNEYPGYEPQEFYPGTPGAACAGTKHSNVRYENEKVIFDNKGNVVNIEYIEGPLLSRYAKSERFMEERFQKQDIPMYLSDFIAQNNVNNEFDNLYPSVRNNIIDQYNTKYSEKYCPELYEQRDPVSRILKPENVQKELDLRCNIAYEENKKLSEDLSYYYRLQDAQRSYQGITSYIDCLVSSGEKLPSDFSSFLIKEKTAFLMKGPGEHYYHDLAISFPEAVNYNSEALKNYYEQAVIHQQESFKNPSDIGTSMR